MAAPAGEAEQAAWAAGGSPRAGADAHPAGHSPGTLGVAACWGAAPTNCTALGNGLKQQIEIEDSFIFKCHLKIRSSGMY